MGDMQKNAIPSLETSSGYIVNWVEWTTSVLHALFDTGKCNDLTDLNIREHAQRGAYGRAGA